MNEQYKEGIEIMRRLPEELQCLVKQHLLLLFWEVMKHRPCELLDDIPFYPLDVFSRRARCYRSQPDKQRVTKMNRKKYVTEITSTKAVQWLDEVFGIVPP